jgi:hypothetical protein
MGGFLLDCAWHAATLGLALRDCSINRVGCKRQIAGMPDDAGRNVIDLPSSRLTSERLAPA